LRPDAIKVSEQTERADDHDEVLVCVCWLGKAGRKDLNEQGGRMSTTVIVAIVVVAIVVLALAGLATSRQRAKRLEEHRLEAREHREEADSKARKAEQARLQAEEQAERARKQQAEADELRRHAAEIDPDTEPVE
jgi:uncharacterized protein HemX